MTSRYFTFLAVLLLCAWSASPVVEIFIWSISPEVEITAIPPHWIPQKPQLTNYLVILGLEELRSEQKQAATGIGVYSSLVQRGILNSIIVAIPAAVAATLFASLGGYVFGRLRFPHKGKLLFTFFFSQMLPAISIILPFYIIFLRLGLIGTHIGLIMLHLSMSMPLITWILMGYFATLPIEIERAARVDGCNRIQALWRVVMPIAMPGIVIGLLMAFMLSWNEFLFAMILTVGTNAVTLPPVVAGLFQYAPEYSAMSSAIMISLAAPIVLAVALQRFMKQVNIVDPFTSEMV